MAMIRNNDANRGVLDEQVATDQNQRCMPGVPPQTTLILTCRHLDEFLEGSVEKPKPGAGLSSC